MEQLVVNNKKFAVKGIEGSDEYNELVHSLLLEEYDKNYSYSVLVYESKHKLNEYAEHGLNIEFAYLPECEKRVKQLENKIISLGYRVPNVEEIVLEAIRKSLKIEYGEDAKIEAIPYHGVTFIRMQEVKDALTKINDFRSYIFQEKDPKNIIKIFKGEIII